MIKLTVIKEEYHLKDGWFKNIIEYGKDEISLMKEKLNLIDENKLQMIPLMKQHIAAVDFIQTALLAFKALCKREIHGTCNMDMDTTNITTTSVIRDISDKKIGDIIHEKTIIGENVKGGNSSSDSSSDNGRKITIDPNSDKYIGIPSDEDVISNIIEIPEWACNEKHSTNYIIYCQGELLHAVMMLNIFKDSKTFVDKPLKRDPTEIASDFKKKFPRDITVNDREAIRQFIDENFDEEGHELEKCELVDWEEQPEKLLSITDPQLRQFALNVNLIWKSLCRTIKKEVMKYPERHSLLYVPYEFIVPGGRFREFYYWDTYWVIKGLLASGMQETSRRIILNFEYLVKTIGFIPNGGRVYYLRRSQPPLFIPMVYEYYMATEDDDFLRSIMNTMEMEFNFWKTSRMINVTINERNHSVFYYRADSNVPRPESYREDYQTAERVDRQRRRKLWRDIASAAESGWDFSSRWFQNRKSMDTIVTSDIIPVDLNAFMYWNMKILAHLQGEIGNLTRRDELNRERSNFVDTFEAVFFDTREGAWFDLNLKTGEHYDDAYPSLAVPLFTECYHMLNSAMVADVLETLQRKGLLQFPGGIPASLMKGTNQQWDYPNGWAPINHMIIEGLRKSNNPTMQQRAFEIANKWINRNYALYQKDHKMWEKYDVAKEYVRAAKGGEYENQYGFGWTNGVVLDLLVTFNKRAIVKPTGGVTDVHGTGRANISGTNRTLLTRYLGTGKPFDFLWWFTKRILIRTLINFLKCKSSGSSG
ncbi:Trehalase family protein [Brugia pahangi]